MSPAGPASFTLDNPGGAGLHGFCLGQGFQQGEIPAGRSVVCDLADFQATVLNHWPDGSARFAVLAGRASVAAGASLRVVLRPGEAPTGSPVTETDLLAALPDVALSFEPFGRVALRPLVGVASSYSTSLGRFTPGRVRTLISGPQLSSWVYQSALPGQAHLTAWFEVRCWASGMVEILPWLENGWWNVPGPTSYEGTLRYEQGGATLLTKSLLLPHHARVAAATPDAGPWRSGGSALDWRHDVLYLQATGLVPTYFSEAREAVVARQVSSYEPMGLASFPSSMGSGGYARHIGPLPEWDVVFLCSRADPRARRAVLINALAHGRWCVHYRDETTARPVSPTRYPTRVINGSGSLSGVASVGASGSNDYTPAATGTVPGYWADSHHCSTGYLAYLISGWHYFIEETQMVASVCTYKMGNLPRQGAKSLFLPDQTMQPRGVAWSHRTLAQVLALTPKDDPLLPDYVAVMEANIAYNHAVYVAQPNNPFGLMAPYGDAYTPAARGTTEAGSTSTVIRLGRTAVPSQDKYVGWTLSLGGQDRKVLAYDGPTQTATVDSPFTVPTAGVSFRVSDHQNRVPMWMEDFMTGVFGYQVALGLPVSADARTRLASFFQWKARSVVGRFGTPGRSDEFNYCDAAQYELAAAPTDEPDFNGGTGPFYPNWGAIYKATTGKDNVATANDRLRGAYFPDASSYWGNLQPALAYAVTHGVPGAAAAYARMTGDPGWPQFTAYGNNEPVWTVRPPR